MGRALRAAVAGAGSIAALALFAPAPAMAHPCASANANVASSFLSVNNAMWAGMRPVEVGHDCSRRGRPGHGGDEDARGHGRPARETP